MTYNFADSNRSSLRFIPETQWGQTPTSGKSRLARTTSHNLQTKKNTVVSNEIRSDRMIPDVIQTEMMSDGSVNFEFSAGAFDDFLQAFVLGTWTRPMTLDSWTGTLVSWTSTSVLTLTGVGDATGYFTAGRRIKTNNFLNPVNNGYFQITSTATSGSDTTVTVTTTTSIVEAGNVKTSLEDANDVIVLNDTLITAVDSDSSFTHTGAFTSAIAAGQLLSGQRIFVEGLGYEVGSFAFAAVAVAGTTTTVNDGVSSYVFVAGTDYDIGSSQSDSATNLAAAINRARVLGVGTISTGVVYPQAKATVSTNTVNITNLLGAGGTLSKTEPLSGTNVTLSAFSGGDNSQHGVYTIVSVTNDKIFVTPTPTVNSNSGSLAVTVKGSMLRNPSASAAIIPQSFTIETGFEDVGQFLKQDGMRVQDFTIDVNSAQVMTGTLSFMGRQTTTSTLSVLGNSPYVSLATVNNEIMNATTDVGAISKNGVSLVSAVKQIKLDGKAQLRNQMAVGSKFPVGIGTGRFEMSGSFQAYFENFDLYNNFLNHDTIALSFPFTDLFGHYYQWTIPALKLTADPVHVKGVDQDVMEEITFQSFRDPVTNCMLQIDRFSSIHPV